MKKLLLLIGLVLVVLAGCGDKEEEAVKEAKQELEKIGMNEEEQDATLEAVGINSEEESNQGDEEGAEEKDSKQEKEVMKSFSIIEKVEPFGGESFSNIKGASGADVYYEDEKTLVSFKVKEQNRYYVSVMENDKWTQKDQAYQPFEQAEYKWTMNNNYLYGEKLFMDGWSHKYISDLTLYEDKFMEEGTSRELTNLNEHEFSGYGISRSTMGDLLTLNNFEYYVLSNEGVLKSTNINQDNFSKGKYDECYSSFINFEENALYCTSPFADITQVYKFNINENDWEYTEDGADVKEGEIDEDGKIVMNSKGVLGSISSVDVYGGDDYLSFQAFDQNLNPIGEKVKIEVPVNDGYILGKENFDIDVQDDAFVIWYKYFFKGKPALAKYVIQDSND